LRRGPIPAAESADAVKAVGVVGDEHDGRPAVDVPVVSGEAQVDPPASGAEQVGEQSRVVASLASRYSSACTTVA
jgi:hypothetical protein